MLFAILDFRLSDRLPIQFIIRLRAPCHNTLSVADHDSP